MHSSAQPGLVRSRRTQQERRDATRKRLLDATVECLIDRGYHGATTLEIERRAGVSRGARIHHFPTKAALLAAAVDHLYEQVSDSYATAFGAAHPGATDAQRVHAGLRMLWSIFQARDYCAVIELLVAARTDDELRACLHEVGERHRALALAAAAEYFGLPASVAQGLIESIHAALMGLLLRRNVEHDDPGAALVLNLLEDMVVARLPPSKE